MKQLIRSVYTFEAIDGTVFDTREECVAYEARLPKHLVFCLQAKYTAEQLREVTYFQLGYASSYTTTEYESPSFLRQGGDYEVSHSSDTVLEIVHGELSDVVTYALSTSWARNNNKFIRKIKVTDLTS